MSYSAVQLLLQYFAKFVRDSVAEWSKALRSGRSPKGRGFEPHRCQILLQQNVGMAAQRMQIEGAPGVEPGTW